MTTFLFGLKASNRAQVFLVFLILFEHSDCFCSVSFSAFWDIVGWNRWLWKDIYSWILPSCFQDASFWPIQKTCYGPPVWRTGWPQHRDDVRGWCVQVAQCMEKISACSCSASMNLEWLEWFLILWDDILGIQWWYSNWFTQFQWPHLVCAQLPGQTSSPVPFRYFREERTTWPALHWKLGDHFINGACHCLVLLSLNGLYLFDPLWRT